MSLFNVPNQVAITSESYKVSVIWGQLFTNITNLLNLGYPQPAANSSTPQSVTIPIGKLTTGGMNGSLTFTNGLLTSAAIPT
jgi:hypothetical protein